MGFLEKSEKVMPLPAVTQGSMPLVMTRSDARADREVRISANTNRKVIFRIVFSLSELGYQDPRFRTTIPSPTEEAHGPRHGGTSLHPTPWVVSQKYGFAILL